jgi:hypothetical protein
MRRRRYVPITLAAVLITAGLFIAAPTSRTAADQNAPAASATVVSATPISVVGLDWFDSALYRHVINAGTQGVPLSSISGLQNPQTASSAASSPCLYSSGTAPTGATVPYTPSGLERAPVGLGPGTWLISLFCTKVGGVSVPDGFAWCTANFVFQNGSSFGLGTAGHCAASDALGSPVTAVVTPPPEVCANGGSCAPGIYAIGTFSVVRNNGLGDDFAIVKVYPQFNSWMRSTMPVYGGPTGSFTGGLAGVPGQTLSIGGSTVYTPAYYPSTVGFCGNGIAVGTGDTCRSGAALFASATWYAWYGASTPGDSGSGVELLGDYASPTAPVPAVADLTHIIILYASINRNGQVTEGPAQPAMIAGTQISKILSIAGSWRLVSGGLP